MKLPNFRSKAPGLPSQNLEMAVTPILSVVFSLSTISVLGIGDLTIEGVSLTTAMLSWNGVTLTWGGFLGIFTVLAAYGLNDRDLEDFTDTQSWITYAVAFSVLILSIAPTLRNAIASSTAAAWLVFTIQLTGFGVIAGLDKKR